MSEIKSTLELALERTRNMTLSDEEKREAALNQFRQELNGLLHKFLEGHMDFDQFRRKMREMERPAGAITEKILAGEVLHRITPRGENDKHLQILSEICGIEAGKIEKLLQDHLSQVRAMELERIAELKKELRDSRQIYGRAVRPNLAADSTWNETESTAAHRVLEAVKREVESLITS